MGRRKRKQERLPLTDNDLNISNEIFEDLKKRINNLTGLGEKEIIEEEGKTIFLTRNMPFVTLIREEEFVNCPMIEYWTCPENVKFNHTQQKIKLI